VKKVELTERQAVGLAGAIKLLKAGGWPPEKVLPFVREISTRSDITVPPSLEHVKVTFWFNHNRTFAYAIDVTIEQTLRINRFRWKLVCAEGDPFWAFHCLFDDNELPNNIGGEAPYLELVNC